MYLMFGSHGGGEGGTFRGSMITLSDRMLVSPDREAIMAHELAHLMLDHHLDPRPPWTGNQRDYHVWQQPRELEANWKAVEILQRVKEVSEREALMQMYEYLLAAHRAGNYLPTHLPPCEEIGDLLGRFPQHATWTASLECSPPALAARADPTKRPARTFHVPSRDGSLSDQVVYAYFTDSPPPAGTFLRSTTNPNMPQGVNEFYADSDQVVALFIALRQAGQTFQIVSRWYDQQGAERKMIHRTMQQAVTRGSWTWQTHVVPITDLFPYPGQWIVKVSVDGAAVGEYRFALSATAGSAQK